MYKNIIYSLKLASWVWIFALGPLVYSQPDLNPVIRFKDIERYEKKPPLKAIEYTFHAQLSSVNFIDSASLYLLDFQNPSKVKEVQGMGFLGFYDGRKERMNWTLSINYDKYTWLYRDSIFTVYSTDSVTVYNLYTGHFYWKKALKLDCISPQALVITGFRTNIPPSNLGEYIGLDLHTGNELWSQPVDEALVEDYFQYIKKDTSVLLLSDELVYRNLVTGANWRYPIKTFREYRTVNDKSMKEFMKNPGRLERRYIRNEHEIIRELHSNLFLDSLHLYLATMDQLTKIRRKTGQIVWKVPLPEDFTGRSVLKYRNGSLWLINLGSGYYRDSWVPTGKPYIAKVDALSGTLFFLNRPTAKADVVSSSYLRSNGIILDYIGLTQVIDYTTGKVVKSQKLHKRKWDYPVRMKTDVIFQIENDTVVTQVSRNHPKAFVYWDKGDDMIVMDSNFHKVDRLPIGKVAYLRLAFRELAFVSNLEDWYVLNSDHHLITKFKAPSSNFTFYNNTLLIFKGNKLLELDISQLLPPGKRYHHQSENQNWLRTEVFTDKPDE